MDHVYAVIMAGGAGTRFWPLSREKMPKQLLRIFSADTMIQETVKRILPFVARERIRIVATAELAEAIGLQLTEKFGGNWRDSFIAEPAAKNTAPALGLAAVHLQHLDAESVMIVLAADHFIREESLFLRLLGTAVAAAGQGMLVTLGITPDRPETGYGYIRAGDVCLKGDVGEVCNVEAFVEKPDLGTARDYLKSGKYLWNSGMFVWRTEAFLMELAVHQPDLYRGLQEIAGDTDKAAAVFRKLKPISVDHAVMEKTARAAVIPAAIGWSDVGSWGAVADVAPGDGAGNIMAGNVLDIGSVNSVINADRRLVATIGLKDMIVVDTPDATLVCSREKAQDVKLVVDELKKRGAPEAAFPRTVRLPWGSYMVLAEGDRFKVKEITILPGARLSLQYHEHRSEHWTVVAGRARVTNGDDVFDLGEGEGTFIAVKTEHRLENQGRERLIVIEVQYGEKLEEEDIVRLDDDYNRVGKGRQEGAHQS
jgi:mannose-1-phosphate guanylyltransferase/mannose-6-phosphate isomerase